jgi:hypothetical protein
MVIIGVDAATTEATIPPAVPQQVMTVAGGQIVPDSTVAIGGFLPAASRQGSSDLGQSPDDQSWP